MTHRIIVHSAAERDFEHAALYYQVSPSVVKVIACQHVRRDARHWLRRIDAQEVE